VYILTVYFFLLLFAVKLAVLYVGIESNLVYSLWTD